MTAAVCLLAAFAFTACSAPAESDEVSVSAECTAAFEEMAANVEEINNIDSMSNPGIGEVVKPTLESCSTAAEWLKGANANPAALGYTDSSTTVTEEDLEVWCYSPVVESTPVCQDAKERGLLAETGW